MRDCGRNRTEVREREWVEGTVSQSTGHVKRSDNILPDALEMRDRVVGSGPAQQAMLSEGSDPANPPKQTFDLIFFLNTEFTMKYLRVKCTRFQKQLVQK